MPLDLPPYLRPLPDNDEILIPSRQMPAYVGLSIQTLARWRHEGKGAGICEDRAKDAYRIGSIRLWIEANCVSAPQALHP